jgi:hypothetical protein
MIARIESGPRLSATGASHMKKWGPLSGLRSTAGFPFSSRKRSSISDISDEISLEMLRGEAHKRQEQAHDRN